MKLFSLFSSCRRRSSCPSWTESSREMNFFRTRRQAIQIRVSTYAEELDFQIHSKEKVKDIFERVCNAISVREKWFFGLGIDTSDGITWLKTNKELLRQIPTSLESSGTILIRFLVKFYPESIEEELVLPNTQNLFYLQLRDEVISERLRVQAEEAILLASYNIQAQIGDIDDFDDIPPDLGNGQSVSWSQKMIEKIKSLQPILPSYTFISNKSMTKENWFQEVFQIQQTHRGLSFEESKLEYIKLCSKIVNFGVIYFEIKVGKEFETSIDHWLGVSCIGINLYSMEDKLNPKKNWVWTQVDDLNYKGEKFIIKPSQLKTDEHRPDEVVFYSETPAINEIILELCQGNHQLFFQRRQADTIEVQQMKLTAREDKERRAIERSNLLKEREARKIAEHDNADLREQVIYFRDQAMKCQKELDKAAVYNERKQLHTEEINLMQLQISQKDAIIDEYESKLIAFQKENEMLRQKLAALSLEKQRVPQDRIVEQSYPLNTNSNFSPKLPDYTNPFGDFRNETKSNSQEKTNINYAMAFVNQLTRESERMKVEQSDQARKMEASFTQIRHGLENQEHPFK